MTRTKSCARKFLLRTCETTRKTTIEPKPEPKPTPEPDYTIEPKPEPKPTPEPVDTLLLSAAEVIESYSRASTGIVRTRRKLMLDPWEKSMVELCRAVPFEKNIRDKFSRELIAFFKARNLSIDYSQFFPV